MNKTWIVRTAEAGDADELVALVAGFRQALAQLRNKDTRLDVDASRSELAEYQVKGFPIYMAQAEGGELVGYLVCQVDERVVRRGCVLREFSGEDGIAA